MIDALNPWHYFWRVVLSLCLCESLFLFPRILVGDAVKDETRNLDILSLKIVNVYHAIVVGPIAAYYLVFGYLAGGDGPDEALTAAVSRAVALDASAAPALFSGGLAQEPAAYLTSITVGFFIWDLARLEIWPPSGGGERELMVAHHVVSILVWPIAALNGVAGPFLLHFLSTELSSPCLQSRWCAQYLFGRGSAGDVVASVAFALAFFIVRSSNAHVVLHAALAARMYSAETHPDVPASVRYLGAATACLPPLLNMMWTLQILKMGKKMLLGKKAKRA
mmetsp:Transcript_10765/g.33159  ORF Transcript_10765/g.33159 Transcript_10765/m.33159 type:complete len:279 (+) Transcript_10765:202-1038(+)